MPAKASLYSSLPAKDWRKLVNVYNDNKCVTNGICPRNLALFCKRLHTRNYWQKPAFCRFFSRISPAANRKNQGLRFRP